jgi:hypothetical protein
MGQNPQVVAFIAELQHWRQVNGCSQKALARLVGYTPLIRQQGGAGINAAQPELC